MQIDIFNNDNRVINYIKSGKVKYIQFRDKDDNVFVFDVNPNFISECKEENDHVYVKVITPKFNDKEKSYLRSMLDKFDGRVNYIVRRDSGNGQYNIFFGLDHGKSYVILQSPDTMFNEMVLDRKYDPGDMRKFIK